MLCRAEKLCADCCRTVTMTQYNSGREPVRPATTLVHTGSPATTVAAIGRAAEPVGDRLGLGRQVPAVPIHIHADRIGGQVKHGPVP